MEVTNYLRKFKLLLEYVFDGKVLLTQDNIDKLLKFLEDRGDNSPGKILTESPAFSDLIYDKLENSQNILLNAPNSVKAFFLELITITFRNELQFTKMLMLGFQYSSIKTRIVAPLNFKSVTSELQLACIKLATAQIAHCSGIKLLLEHKVWTHILYPNIYQRPLPVVKAANNFVSQMIKKLNEFEMKDELTEILEYLVRPIRTSGYFSIKEIDNVTDVALADELWTSLSALRTILIDMEDEPDNHVTPMMRTYFFLDHLTYPIANVTRCTKVVNICLEMNIRFYYAALRHVLFNHKVSDFCNGMVAVYHNNMRLCIRKRDVASVLDLTVTCNLFWSNFEKKYKDSSLFSFPLTFETNGVRYELNNQLIVHIVEPLMMYANINKPPGRTAEKNLILEQLQSKMGNAITDHMFSTSHLFRKLILGCDLKKVTIQTLKELFRLKGHLNATQAGIIFQNLYHLLDVFVVSDGAGGLILNENPIKSPDDVRLLSLVLEAIQMLLKEHNISWYENVEIVSLQEVLMNLLKQNMLNQKHIVQVLDLINLCVKKFLSPNMTLLVESRQHSTLTEIGAVMKMYMQHEGWEVRDSALNLLLSCTDIAFVKYIPLQKVISENMLMILAAQMALTDTEYYAQCTALKCLAVATKIEHIWRDVLISNQRLYMHLIYILRHNPEGMVRKEAVRVLTRVYTNQQISVNLQTAVHKVMMFAALDDLHWEVQLAALQFWEQVIKTRMTYRGMIDGKFPAVTFSKEKRKIIKLDEKEIIRQLSLIMNDLSDMGCLTVLYECMDDVYSLQVMDKAYCLARELIETLDKYKFVKITDNAITYETDKLVKEEKVDEDAMAIDLMYDSSNEESRDKVIDSILSTYLSELLIELQDNSIQPNTDDMDEDIRLQAPRRQMIHPNKFLEIFKGTDFLSRIKGKRNWYADEYSRFDVLLDELLDI